MLQQEIILETLALIEEDNSVPKNVRAKIKATISLIKEENGVSAEVKKDQVLQQLEDLGGDPNMPAYTRTQLLQVVSNLESGQ
jgi:uncharacterized protein (UPF0147 family)